MSRASRSRRRMYAAIDTTRRERRDQLAAQERSHLDAVFDMLPWSNPKSDPAADVRAARHEDIEKMKGLGSTP